MATSRLLIGARSCIALAIVALVLAACASKSPAPVEERVARPVKPAPASPAAAASESDWRPPTYTVKRGDTLLGIALDHGLDYRDIAAWNNLENANRISVGQVLRMAPPGAGPPSAPAATGVTTAPLVVPPPVVAGGAGSEAKPAPTLSGASRNTDNYKVQPRAFKEPYTEQALRDAQKQAAATPVVASAQEVVAIAKPAPAPVPEAKPAPAPEAKAPDAASDDDKLPWMWPAVGKIVTGFSDTSNLKGIDIAGGDGQPIVASAGGKVVYVGTGLRGYGKLVIIKHNATYLSAYAHNRDIVVKEGQTVTRGQKIAEMGSTDADQVKLHFEIRKLGRPVDPLKFLPPA